MAKNWAIVVGVNAYRHKTDLKYANNDAKAMADFFKQEGFQEVYCFADQLIIQPHPDQLKNQSVRQLATQPTSSVLQDFLGQRFAKDAKPLELEDNLWFFFAGHGERINNQDCLLPSDYLPDYENRAIPVKFVRECLLSSGAGNVILLMDACRSSDGSRSGEDGIGRDEQPGVITIFSCDENKKAHEIDELKHGAFTAALLEALQYPKKQNSTTIRQLDSYLTMRVPEICREHKTPDQIPKISVKPWQKADFILRPKFATTEDIKSLRIAALELMSIDPNWDLAEQFWFRVLDAVGGVDQQAIKAIKEIERQRNQSAKPSLPTFAFHWITLDATGKQTARKPGSATYFSENLGNGIMLDMVQIPGGSFQMGAVKGEEGASDDEFPQHLVTVKEFWMGKFVVTQEQWKTIALLPQIKTKLKADPSNWKGANLPVEQVSWNQAKEFCDRLSIKTGKAFDLPTEAQWEYACRAGTTTPFHFGETITTDVANFDGNYTYAKALKGTYREKTMTVDSFDPNAFGLYNMHGNVWEWCLDPWHSNYNGAPKDDRVWDASNDSGSKVLRGGSWFFNPSFCRSALRNVNRFLLDDSFVGFRVVCPSSSAPRT